MTTQSFKVISKEELKKYQWSNLKEDLINLWFLDYDNLSDEEKKIYDELEKEKKYWDLNF